MRVLHLDTGRDTRGGQVQVLLLARGLARRGIQSLLLAPAGPFAERARADGLEVHAWRPRGDLDLGALWSVWRRIGASRPDLVHCHTARAHALGVPAANARGVPAIVSRRVAFEVRSGLASALKYRLPVRRYLCVSRAVRETLARAGIPEGRLALVPSGIEISDPPEAKDQSLRALTGAETGAPLVGTLGALSAEKNPVLMARAARLVLDRVPHARFAWIGEGPLRGALEDQVRVLGLGGRFFVLGRRDDAPSLLRGMDLFVLPSSLEGLSNAVLEAQAAGVPVIVTGEGGIRELVQDRVNGRILAAGDAEALADAIVEAIGRPEEAAAWAGRALVTVREYSAENMVRRTLEEYARVLA